MHFYYAFNGRGARLLRVIGLGFNLVWERVLPIFEGSVLLP